MKVQSLINEIRIQLSDARGLGYPDNLLIEFINDGLCMIYQLKPEDFATSRVLQANQGAVQCLDACCDRLISVDGVSDACGNPVDIMREGSVKMAQAFDKRPVNAHARTFSLRPNVNNEFVVHPPVRADETVYFLVTCTTPPDPVQSVNDHIPDCANHEALTNYILYRAYLLETESATSAELAGRMYNQLFQLIGVERVTDRSVANAPSS